MSGKKILIVGPAWVGDMVMAQSLFKAIMQQNTLSLIDVLAPPWTKPLLERMPEVRNAHVMPIGHGSIQLKKRYEIAQQLKSHHYDQAIVLPNSWKSALIPWFAHIPIRTGFCGEFRFGLLNDIRLLDKKRLPQMVQRFVALAYPALSKKEKIKEPILLPKLEIKEAALGGTKQKFSISLNPSVPILALCPGAEFGPSKQWPSDYFATVALAKIKSGFSVWLFGSKNDVEISNDIQAKTNHQCVNFTGKTSLEEAIDLLSLTTLVLTNDSGLMHIAAALGKPIVALYGSTDPSFTPPLTENVRIERLSLPCSPCFKRVCPLEHHRCMRDLSPDRIIKEIDNQCVF